MIAERADATQAEIGDDGIATIAMTMVRINVMRNRSADCWHRVIPSGTTGQYADAGRQCKRCHQRRRRQVGPRPYDPTTSTAAYATPRRSTGGGGIAEDAGAWIAAASGCKVKIVVAKCAGRKLISNGSHRSGR